MPLVNNKVGDDSTVGNGNALSDGKALVDSLIKVKQVSSFINCFCHSMKFGKLHKNGSLFVN